MSKIYLRSLRVSQFRVFPKDQTFEFEGPGVTILAGPNGLGKTSIFEAIEWGLTGKVLRLAGLEKQLQQADQVRRYYARRTRGNDVNGPVEVALEFTHPLGNEKPSIFHRRWKQVKKTDKFEADGQGPDEEIVEVLRSPEWKKPIANLGNYIHDTHMLVQPTGGRWSTLAPQQRWDRLQGLAGLIQLDTVRSSLGKGTKKSISDVAANLQKELSFTEERIKNWRLLIKSRDDALSSFVALGGLAPEQIELELTGLASVLRDVCVSLGASGSDLAQRPLGALVGARDQLHSARDLLAARESILHQSDRLPEEWRRVSSELTTLSDSIRAGTAALASIDLDIKSVEDDILRVDDELVSSRNRLVFIEALRQKLSKLIEALEALPALRASLDEAQKYVDEARRGAEAAAEAKRLADEAVQDAKRYKKIVLDLEERLELLEKSRERIDAWGAGESSLERLRVDRKQKIEEVKGAEEKINQLVYRISGCVEQLKSAEQTLSVLQTDLDAIRRAVGLIVASIHETDTVCPICLTSFEVGVLKLRTTSGGLASTEAIADAERSVASATKLLSDAQSDKAQMEQVCRLAKEKIADIDKIVAAQDAEWKVVKAYPVLEGVRREDALVYVARARSRAAVALDEAKIKLISIDEFDALLERLDALNIALRDREQDIVLRLAKVAELTGRVRQLDAVTSEAAKDTVITDASVAGCERLLAEFASEAVSLSNSIDNLQSLIASLKHGLGEKKEVRATFFKNNENLKRSLPEKERLSSQLLARWKTLSPENDISEAAIEYARQGLERLQRRIAEIGARIDFLQEESEHAERFGVAGKEIQQRASEAGCSSEAEYEAALVSKAEQVQLSVQDALEARELANSLSEDLQEAAEGYINMVLGPLQERINKFHRALSTFPLRRLVLVPRVPQSASVAMDLSVHMRRDVAQNSKPLSALHVMSEGQLSEASLSILLAMSTAYRWSRWPGLLLDDPLQQNDIVHVAAFVDLMCNLVRIEGYQLIISTHDLDLANYMGRKFAATDVGCRIYRFVQLGRAELVYSSP